MWPLLPRPGRHVQLTPVQAERLHSLQARVQVPYDGDDPAHQDALRQLWAAGFPDEPCASLRTERWKDMGWQACSHPVRWCSREGRFDTTPGEDPGTDFRGGGHLALHCHLYMAAHEPELFATLRWKRAGHRSEWEYPFAVAGVNVTFMLVELLDLRSPSRAPATPAGIGFLHLLEDTDVVFEETYCGAFELLDRHWLELRATYMEFPIALRKTKEAVERVLSIGVQSTEELRKLLAMEGCK